MKINVVSNIDRKPDWSFNRMAYALRNYIEDVVVSKEPLLGDFDIVHCIPYIANIRKSRARYKIALMTNFPYWSIEVENATKNLDIGIFESKIIGEEAKNNGIPESKFRVIKPPVDLNKFKISIKIGIVAQIKKTGILERGLFQKGEKELLKLFELSRWENFQFIFAGRGWKEVWAQKYGKKGVNLKFLGELSYDDMTDFYHNIDYFLLPSRFEAGCISILEALASGKPVISRRVGLAPEFKITHYDDVEKLAELLRWIERDYIEHREQVKDLGIKDWVEKYKELYRGLGYAI